MVLGTTLLHKAGEEILLTNPQRFKYKQYAAGSLCLKKQLLECSKKAENGRRNFVFSLSPKLVDTTVLIFPE